MNENELSKLLVHCCYKIHQSIGPGLLESVYETLLFHELSKYKVNIRRQPGIPVFYEGIKLDLGFRADLILEGSLIVEIKSIDNLAPVHYKQVLTYLRLTNIKLGILVNFNVELIKHGIHRVVNNL